VLCSVNQLSMLGRVPQTQKVQPVTRACQGYSRPGAQLDTLSLIFLMLCHPA